jgi:hypothetical protein
MSAPQHFSSRTLREMGRRRGIIYSVADEREFLIDQFSTQTFSYAQMREIQEHFEYRGKGEKSTVIRLNHAFTVEEMKTAAEQLRTTLTSGEKLFTRADGTKEYYVDVQYVETDFSLVRLRQRQRRDANIHFEIDGDSTVVTFPANQRAKGFVNDLKARLATATNITPEVEEILLENLPTAVSRTHFFVDLITGMENFSLFDVVKVRVEKAAQNDTTLLEDEPDEPKDDVSVEDVQMLGVVRAVGLNGENLLRSKVYQDLRKRGYFITSVRWKAKHNSSPYPIVEFDAGFEELDLGGRFRFSVLGWFHQRQAGTYNKTITTLPDDKKKAYLETVDQRSIALYRAIRNPQEANAADGTKENQA